MSSNNIVLHNVFKMSSNIVLHNENSLLSTIKELARNHEFSQFSTTDSAESSQFVLSTNQSPNEPASADIINILDLFSQDPNISLAFTWQDDSISQRVPRQVSNTGEFVSTKCLILFFRTASFSLTPTSPPTPLQFVNSSYDKNTTDCSAPYVTLTFIPRDPSLFSSVDVHFNLSKGGTTWAMDSVFITVNSTNGQKTGSVIPEDISSLAGNSYFCPSTTFTVSDDSFNFVMTHFQIQTPASNDVFYDPRDCRGFISVPILMGYTVFLLMTFVTVVAVWMLSSMQSIERFDDVKKPSFYIPSQDI